MSFQAFCEAFQIKLAKPATPTQIEVAESKLGTPLPKSVRKIYEIANGGKGRSEVSSLEIYSIANALKYARVPRFFDAPWTLWPLIENNDSNPVCVCCAPPLTGYVVLMNHDDAPRLMYRSLENFFAAATAFVADGEYLDTAELASDFESPERTKQDLTAAKRLIALAKKRDALEDEVRTDALRFACDLLSDDDVEQLESLLAFDLYEVEEHVSARLARIKKTKGRRAGGTAKTKSPSETFDSFVVRCGDILTKAGFAANVVEMYGKNTIRLDPGPVWLNMPAFYQERKRADFDAYLIERVRAVARKPRK